MNDPYFLPPTIVKPEICYPTLLASPRMIYRQKFVDPKKVLHPKMSALKNWLTLKNEWSLKSFYPQIFVNVNKYTYFLVLIYNFFRQKYHLQSTHIYNIQWKWWTNLLSTIVNPKKFGSPTFFDPLKWVAAKIEWPSKLNFPQKWLILKILYPQQLLNLKKCRPPNIFYSQKWVATKIEWSLKLNDPQNLMNPNFCFT